MKKAILTLILLFALPFLSNADMPLLKLRASSHPGYLRIVLEGPQAVIDKKSVSQKGRDILISFPDVSFSIQAEGAVIAYSKINKDTVMISPGIFSGIKVFTLKDPSRLVIDAYMKEEKGAVSSVEPQTKERGKDLVRIKTVVIDPGHGGYESGIVKDSNREKNTVLDIARKLGALINSGPAGGLLTRGSDRFMPLSERVNFANSKGADVFFSIHIGHHREIVIYSPVVTDIPSDAVKPYLNSKGQAGYEKDTLVLHKAVIEAVIPAFGENMVSVRPMPYSIISGVESAALMIEFPSFEHADYTDEYISKIANTLYKGLNIYEEIKDK